MENQEIFESRKDLSEVELLIQNIRDEIGKIVVGQHKMVDLLISALLANGHVLIEGYPGLAKTLSARLLAKTIKSDFSRIQFTPDLMPSDVLGTSIFNFKDSSFEFKKGPIFSNIILIDEINRAPAKTQAALFEVMEERQVTIDGETYKMKEPFIIIATQNPIDLEGTYRLPEAQMDRFLFKIKVDYPNLEEELKILQGFHEMKNKNDISKIKPVVTAAAIKKQRALVGEIHVDDKIMRYIAQIVQNTREHRDIMIGASPRASLAILASSKAIAVMNGRDFVTPDDVQYVSDAVLSHRISITPEKEMEGATAEAVIHGLIKSIEVPR